MIRQRIKLSDIAAKTGFSVNTVSHALNDKPDISTETKDIIKKAAKSMGYIKNSSAMFMRMGLTKNIAIIIPDVANPHFSVIIKEIEASLKSFGYTAVIINTNEDESEEKEAIISAVSRNSDGIIICPCQRSKKNIKLLNDLSVPYVFLGRRFDSSSSNYVICNDYNSGFIAAEYLIKKGHKNIIYFNAPTYISSARERLDGIKAAFLKNSLFFPNENIYTVKIGSGSASFSHIKAVIKSREDFTAIIGFSDLIAMQAVAAAEDIGKKVPDDISVMGFDDIMSRFKFPLSLTSVSSHKAEMAQESVSILMNQINGSKEAEHRILDTKIKIRKTVKVLD